MSQEINSRTECAECGIDISDRHRNLKYCSKKCRDAPRFYGTFCGVCGDGLIVRRTNKYSKKYCSDECRYLVRHPDFNQNYFSEPNLENSYWAGFIAADGCIIDSERGQKQLRILLKSTDRSHLENIHQSIGGGGIIDSSYFDERTQKTYSRSCYRVPSNKICFDLANNFNIHPRKSLMHMPPNLGGDFALAFIAGYIDGDGCYWLDKGYPRIRIRGTREVLSWIAAQFDLEKSIWFESGTHAIHFNGKDAVMIRKSFESFDLPLLDRKKSRWEELGLNLSLLRCSG